MFNKKLLHVNSYYKQSGQTPSNFTYTNPDPSLSKVRKIELISASFLNSDFNINATNNTLQFQRESATGLTRTLTENSIYLGKTSGGCFVTRGETNPLGEDRLQLNYKWTKASDDRFFLNLYINPENVQWAEDNQPTGPSHLDVSANSLKIRKYQQNDDNTIYPYFILPTPQIIDEKLVVIPYTFTEAEVVEHNFFWVELTVINNNRPWLFTGYLNNINDFEPMDPSVVNLDEGYKLVLLPSKIGDQLHGFQYMVLTDDFNEYQLQDVKKDGVIYQAFPVNTNIVCSEYNPPVPFFQDDYFSTGDGEFSITNRETGTVTTYDNIVFDLEGQLVRIFELESISIPIGQYSTVDEIMQQLKSAFLSHQQITISKISGNESWLNPQDKITFFSSAKISIDQKYNDLNNPMAYVLGINEDDHLLSNEFVADSIPDLSGVVQVHVHSDTLSMSDRSLNGNQSSDSTICLIPVFSSYGLFNFWSTPFQGKFMRAFQEPTNLTTFDIQLKDSTGRLLTLDADICICFEIIYQE